MYVVKVRTSFQGIKRSWVYEIEAESVQAAILKGRKAAATWWRCPLSAVVGVLED